MSGKQKIYKNAEERAEIVQRVDELRKNGTTVEKACEEAGCKKGFYFAAKRSDKPRRKPRTTGREKLEVVELTSPHNTQHLKTNHTPQDHLVVLMGRTADVRAALEALAYIRGS